MKRVDHGFVMIKKKKDGLDFRKNKSGMKEDKRSPKRCVRRATRTGFGKNNARIAHRDQKKNNQRVLLESAGGAQGRETANLKQGSEEVLEHHDHTEHPREKSWGEKESGFDLALLTEIWRQSDMHQADPCTC